MLYFVVMSIEKIVIVLHRPQDPVNIGAVVRAMHNMGLRRLRLVEPVAFAPADLLRVAHRCDEIVQGIEHYVNLDQALADAVYVVGTAAQQHRGRNTTSDARGMAADLLRRTAGGPVALLFGPEDNGLDLSALNRCHSIVSLPTNPAYPALNLAQSALLLMYELRLAEIERLEIGDWRLAEPVADNPATAGELETLFESVKQALQRIAFFKGRNPLPTMQIVRQAAQRATLTRRETALLTAIAREVVAFLKRRES